MPQNILLIEDDEAGALHVAEALGSATAFHVEWVRTLAAGLESLAGEQKQARHGAEGVGAILVDLRLPDSRGMATFDELFAAAPQIPVLILSRSEDEEIAKAALQRGAQDYLLKERLDAYLLPKAVRSMIERSANADALFAEKERVQVTLNSIGDAVISTDVAGVVTFLNAAAEVLTGWKRVEAEGRPLGEVFHIIDAATRATAKDPMALATAENRLVSLAPNSVLVRRDGVEAAIEDSAAPIHDRRGRVTGAVMVFHDVTASRALSLRLSFLAQHDVLTELPNRALFNDRLAQAIALAQRHRHMLAVLFLDIDHFKSVNDTLGHEGGDRLLNAVARRLQGAMRGTDTLSRQGGDEFVVLLSELAQPQDAALSAQKLLAALGEPLALDGRELRVTGSIGIAVYPRDGADPEELLKHADFAMYHAKDLGRNGYQFFMKDLNDRAQEKDGLRQGLLQAAERGEFVLHYQPKLDLVTGAVTGVEALVRWQHPRRGLVPPAQFIATAEECGAIISLGRWVLREACRQARAWLDQGYPPLSMAINVSSAELLVPEFVAGVQQALAEFRIEPAMLEFEITETFLLQDAASTEVVLRSLKALGVRIALDDFGTGYSSLSHLKKFPIDILKIDQSFVRDLTTDPGDASIVRALIDMGRSLELQVVAEGVETREQLHYLQAQGCPEGQGFYFSRPVGAEELARLKFARPTAA